MNKRMETVYCTACGLRGDPSWEFCAACGNRIVTPEGSGSSDARSGAHEAETSPGAPPGAVSVDLDLPTETFASAGDVQAGQLTGPKRPASLTVLSVLALLVFGLGYLGSLTMLTLGDSSDGLSWSRLVAEPPEHEGGIPWPGWDQLGEGLRGEVSSLSELSDRFAAQYWWAKLNVAGSMMVGPLLIAGWLGMFLGKRWGRMMLYVYVSVWMANKIIYLMLFEEEGVMWFSIAVGMTVLQVSLLNIPSWKAWTTREPDVRGVA